MKNISGFALEGKEPSEQNWNILLIVQEFYNCILWCLPLQKSKTPLKSTQVKVESPNFRLCPKVEEHKTSCFLAESCLSCSTLILLLSVCTSVSLKRSGGHIWRRTQQLPDEGEDLPEDGGHSPARCITVVFLTFAQIEEYSTSHGRALKTLRRG